MNEQIEIQPSQETKVAEAIRRVDLLYGLKGKVGEIYGKASSFFEELRKKYPKEQLSDYPIYHKLSMSGVKEGAHLSNNGDIIEEMVRFVDELCSDYKI